MDEVYVVEIVPTGARGMPYDAVAEVGVCRMFPEGNDYETVFDGRVSMDPLDIGKDSLDFLSDEFGIGASDLYMGDDRDSVVKGLQDRIFGRECTSFDVRFTFGKFLCFEPWDTTRELTLLPSYSIRLPTEVRNPPEGKSPLEYAYEKFCPGDPANVGESRHAVDLAQISVSLMMLLRREGLF